MACSQGTEETLGSPDPDPATGTVPTSLGMCAEMFSADTLQARDHAFDGTVLDIAAGSDMDPNRSVTFEVNEWFSGPGGDEITLRGSGFGSGAVTPDGVSAEVGDRLLVSGDDDFVWECGGFTVNYDAETAAEWRGYLE